MTVTDDRKAGPDGDMGCGVSVDYTPGDDDDDPIYYDCGADLDEYLGDTLAADSPYAIALSNLVEIEILQRRVAVELVVRVTGTTHERAQREAEQEALSALLSTLSEYGSSLSVACTRFHGVEGGWDVWVRAQTEGHSD